MALAKQTIEIFSFFVLNLVFGPFCILASKDADIPKLDISSLWQLVPQICVSYPEFKPLWGDAKKKETCGNLFKPGVKLSKLDLMGNQRQVEEFWNNWEYFA